MKYSTHYNPRDIALFYTPAQAFKTFQWFHTVWKPLEAASLLQLQKSSEHGDLGIITKSSSLCPSQANV